MSFKHFQKLSIQKLWIAKICLILTLGFILSTPNLIYGQQTFILQDSLVGVRYASAAWADFDRNGDLDIVITGLDTFGTRIGKIYRYNGNAFVLHAEIDSVANGAVAWGDYDNDNDLDLALAGSSNEGYITRIYTNQNGHFQWLQNVQLEGAFYSDLAWGDYDSDGDLDLLVRGRNSNNGIFAKLYRNNGNANFEEIMDLDIDSGRSITWADYDGDGDTDLLVANRIYRNDGNGALVIDTTATDTLAALNAARAAWGDYDNDGDLDVVLIGFSVPAIDARIYRNQGNGRFVFDVNASENLRGVREDGQAAWGDFDNDGDLDLLINGYNGTPGDIRYITFVYENNGDGTFWESNEILTGTNRGGATWGDYDGDGDLDILVYGDAGQTNGFPYVARKYIAYIYRNTTLNGNAPPSPPTGLAHSFASISKVSLRWNSASDSETPSQSLTYNLRLGTSPGAVDIISPMADLNTGGRHLPQMGNASHDTSWTITDLEPGRTYYWSVQAIDQGFASSPFAQEGSFTMPESLFVNIEADLIGLRSGRVFWFDYDNDNDLDILLYGEPENGWTRMHIYKNNLEAGFTHDQTASSSLLTGYNPSSIMLADLNKDGFVDLLLEGVQDNGLRRGDSRLNTGNGQFEIAYHASASPFTATAVTWGDFDHDGDMDQLTVGEADTGLAAIVWLTDGFLRKQVQPGIVGVRNARLDWGDFNGDGFPDLLLVGDAGEGVGLIGRAYAGQGDGTFTDINVELPGISAGDVAWGDYSGDGYADILIVGLSDTPLAKLYRYDPQHGFLFDAAASAGLSAWDEAAAAWGDYDNDGDLDLVIAGMENVNGNPQRATKIFKNDNGQFAVDNLASRGLPAVDKADVAWGDFDNDQRLDLLISGETDTGSYITQILRNTTDSQNTPPDAPAGLQAAVDKKKARLSWLLANDAQTDSRSLTYNLRIGTTPGGSDVLSPLAGAADGYRRIAHKGNAGHSMEWVLEDLPYETTFYWSVQAIDHSFAGSAFSAEGSFSTPPPLFRELAYNMPAVNRGSITWADYSTDGALDLLQAGWSPDAQTIFHRQFAGTFDQDVLPTSLVEGVGRGTGVFADYDGDGDLDVFIVGDSDYGAVARLYYYYPYSFAFFEDTSATKVFDPVFESAAAWGDMDNDGDPDLVVSGASLSGQEFTKIYYNTNGRFRLGDSLIYLRSGSISLADYDKDGDLDILLTGKDAESTPQTVIIENGNDRFVIDAVASNSLPGIYTSDADWGDFDNDGDWDILLSGNAGADNNIQRVTYLYENRNGRFEPFDTLAGANFSNVAWGDYNNDGFLDIILAGNTELNFDQPILYKNNAGESFEAQTTDSELFINYSRGVAWGDFDRDGDLDLAIQSRVGNSKIYENTINIGNEPPAPPQNPVAEVADNTVILRWRPPEDDHTPQKALTYNVRLLSLPDSLWVVPPMSRQDGLRRMPVPGNAGQDTFFVLKQLPDGKRFSWAVQAIDQAYRGSAFSDEQEFVTSFDLPGLDTLRFSGPTEKRVNLVFLAEGYTVLEIEQFRNDATTLANAILDFEPFRSYASYFNVFTISVASIESGSDHPSRGLDADTYFRSTFEAHGASNFITLPQEGVNRVNTLLDDLMPEYDLVMMIVNDEDYGGSAIPWRDRALAFVSMAQDAASTAIHELGHTFGLGDEYSFQLDLPFFEYPNVTAETERGSIRWNHWIDDNTPIPTEPQNQFPNTVGLFEGANYNPSGWFRPSLDCKMRTNAGRVVQFCAVCREWLVKVLYGYKWAFPGLPEPNHRLRPVRAIDNFAPENLALNLNGEETIELQVQPMAPTSHALQIQWLVDGGPVEGATENAFTAEAANLGNGEHTIAARVWDPTDWVRLDPQGFLADTVSWQITVAGVTSVAENQKSAIPEEFVLQQNFPNPFNPATKIGYGLPEASKVRVSIYDALGKRIAVLQEGIQPAGYHDVTWRARVASGVYFYRLEAISLQNEKRQFNAMRKMVLLR